MPHGGMSAVKAVAAVTAEQGDVVLCEEHEPEHGFVASHTHLSGGVLNED